MHLSLYFLQPPANLANNSDKYKKKVTKVKTTIKNIKQLQKITSEIISLMQINTITKALFGVP